MSDLRKLLESLDRINEGQKWDDLDKIVTAYAKPGMDFNDLIRMEKEAVKSEPADAKQDDNIFGKMWAGAKQLASTESFRIKYVLAHAADKLGLPGLYDSKGKAMHYLDDQGEAQTVGGGNRSEATKINDAGLLPEKIAAKFKLEPKATSARTYGLDDPDAPKSTASAWKNPNVQGTAGVKDSSITLSDGSKFDYTNQTSVRLARARAAKLLSRYNQLIGKMNESVPVSLRGYLAEYAIEELLSEALSPQEEKELQTIYKDLSLLANWNEKGGQSVLGRVYSIKVKEKLAKAPAIIKDPEAVANARGKGKDTGSEDNMDDKANTGDVEPGGKFSNTPVSKTLADFAKSGKGGLQNDPDEVAAIKELQTMLQDQGFDVSPDGKYGSQTMKAVMEFQKLMGLKTDGDAGPNTIGALLPFDNFIYGDGGTLKDMIDDIEKASNLINKGKGKAAGTPAGAPDSAMMKPVADSVDFRGLINLVESLLAEGLSQTEMDELTSIIDNLKDGYEQISSSPEIPKPFKDRLINAINDAGTVGIDKEPTELPPEKTATDKAADATGGNPKEVAAAIKSAISGLGTDDAAVHAAISTIKSKEEWDKVVAIYPEVYDDIRGDMDSYTGDYKRVVSALAKLGVVMPPEGTTVNKGTATGVAANQGDAATGVAANQGAGQPQGVAGATNAQQGQNIKTPDQAMNVIKTLTPAEVKELMATLGPEDKALFTQALQKLQQQKQTGVK